MERKCEGESMATKRKCKSCEHEFQTWVEFCPNCAEPVEGYARPAGFWIRVGANIIDSLIFLPLAILGSRTSAHSQIRGRWHPLR